MVEEVGETTFPSAAQTAVPIDVTWSLVNCAAYSLPCSMVMSLANPVFHDRHITVFMIFMVNVWLVGSLCTKCFNTLKFFIPPTECTFCFAKLSQ
jgi:hypothetical protein